MVMIKETMELGERKPPVMISKINNKWYTCYPEMMI